MRRMLGTLGGLLLLADGGAAQGQIAFGPVGYTGWGQGGGIGFSVSGRRFHVSGFLGSGGGVVSPIWGPVAPPLVVPPWGPYGYWPPPPVWGPPVVVPPPWWGPPVVVAPPPVVVVPPPVVALPAGFVADRPPAGPVPDPLAGARVDAAVQRGDLIAVRPRGAGPVLPQPAGVARQPAPAPPKELPPAVQEVNRARAAFAAGQYGRAAERLAEAITADPAGALPYFLLAQAHVARGDYAEAVAAIRDGMRRAPDWPEAKFNLKEIYGQNAAGFDEHLAALRKAAAADPADPTLGFLLGYHLWFLGEKAEATKLFERASRQVRDNAVIERFLLEARGKKA